ncbi:Ribosome binding protein 1 [Mactra antiquata]
MELQIILIGAVVFIVSAVLIYFISAFTMKEKTFEEVMAEQKRAQEEEQQKTKQDKKVEPRRRFKGKGKVKGDQSPKVSASIEPEVKEHKMVNLELEPEIIEPVEADKPLKMKKVEKVAKPILHNKGEKTPVIPDDNVEEFVHRGPAPKDDLELKHIHDKKEKPKKAKKQEVEQPIVEEIMQVTQTKMQAAAPPARGDSKAVKQESGNAKLISSVKTASLSDFEVQSLIEILLMRQGGSPASSGSDWNKKTQKGDQVMLLKKQLEEKERSLQEEQQMVMAANTRLKEIRQDLNQEKVRFQTMEKNYKDKMDYQNREMQALQSRVQHTHDQHMVETNQLRGLVQKLEAQVGDQSRVQRLVDENNSLKEVLAKSQAGSLSSSEANNLKQKVGIMEKELSNNALKLNSSENTKKALEQKVTKLENDMKKYESQKSSNENVMGKRVDEMTQELRKSEAKNASLYKDLQTKEQAVDTAQKECVYLKTQLKELEKSLTDNRDMEEKLKVADRQKIDIEGNLKNLQKRIDNFEQEKTALTVTLQNKIEGLSTENASLKTDVQNLKQEANNLNVELKTAKEQVQTAASSNVKSQQNGDVSGMISITDHEKQLASKDTELSTLQKEIAATNTELSTVKQDLEKQKKKNNDELSASQDEVEKYDRSVMQRLFPDISVYEKQSHKSWMSDFEKKVSNKLQQQQASSDNSAKYESKIEELEEESSDLQKQLKQLEDTTSSLTSKLQDSDSNCNKLQSQVSQYRLVLGETENKLTQLENSVEAEEKKWQEKLQAKEIELQQAQAEISSVRKSVADSAGSQEMKVKISDLETQLEKSNEKCSELEKQVKEADTKVVEYNVQITELKKSSANITVLTADVDDLRKELEAEKKKNKDLASQIVKLNGIIKTGHDALTQEQNLVQKLREQLSPDASKSNSVSNSNSSDIQQASSQTSLNDENGTSV